MAGHKKWRDLAAPLHADPVRHARIEEGKRALDVAIALGRLRERRGATQMAVAGALGTSQANVSRIEHEGNLQLSTLREYIEALGGRLEIAAVFPDMRVELDSPASHAEEEAGTGGAAVIAANVHTGIPTIADEQLVIAAEAIDPFAGIREEMNRRVPQGGRLESHVRIEGGRWCETLTIRDALGFVIDSHELTYDQPPPRAMSRDADVRR